MGTRLDVEQWEKKLLGKTIVALGRTINDPANQIAEEEIKRFAPRYRILGPHSNVTMDYREDRLNIHVDGDGGTNQMQVIKVTVG